MKSHFPGTLRAILSLLILLGLSAIANAEDAPPGGAAATNTPTSPPTTDATIPTARARWGFGCAPDDSLEAVFSLQLLDTTSEATPREELTFRGMRGGDDLGPFAGATWIFPQPLLFGSPSPLDPMATARLSHRAPAAGGGWHSTERPMLQATLSIDEVAPPSTDSVDDPSSEDEERRFTGHIKVTLPDGSVIERDFEAMFHPTYDGPQCN